MTKFRLLSKLFWSQPPLILNQFLFLTNFSIEQVLKDASDFRREPADLPDGLLEENSGTCKHEKF
jgi:hypothetical protein